MCGFVVTNSDKDIKAMLYRQKHRGPDAQHFWSDGNISMGHALLDISGETQLQPYKTKRGNILVFNGEMYDTTNPNDTVFLANGIDTYGTKFIEHTNWHGSLVHYNPKEQTLMIARDHFGAKPCWVYTKGGEITVSTSLRSFINKERNHELDWEFEFNPLWCGRKTPWKHIKKVAPGEVIIVDLKKRKLTYKNLWNYFKIKSKKLNNEVLREKLVNSIQRIAFNRQKTALFLSGGLDSTFALAAVKDMGLDLTVYICGYEKVLGDHITHRMFVTEADMAIKTCKEWGVPYKVVQLNKDEVANLSREWIGYTHFPWVDRNRQAPRYKLCQAAAADGCKVVLTGDSADEYFTGYYHHEKRFLKGYDEETVRRAKKASWFPDTVFSKTDMFNNGLFYDLLHTSEQNILATDQTCGMFGLESRPVYLGQNFARWIYQINGDTKFIQHKEYRSGSYKYILREVLGDMLPAHVRNRKTKVGWSSPWDNNHPPSEKRWRKEDLSYLKVL